MHATQGQSANASVPAFLVKLWKLVEDNQYDNLICWTPTGTSFLIKDQVQFSKEVLPMYFKHNNMASFIRQLNMYGFRKVVNIEQGSLRSEKDDVEFQHQFFLKENDLMLRFIKRKVPIGRPLNEVKVDTESISQMVTDMKQMLGKQESMNGQLSQMKSENEVLWRQILTLRQQHDKQTMIINKIIHFLMNMDVKHFLSLKRKMLPMSSHDNKVPRLTELQGPVIHDVTDTVDENIASNSRQNNPGVASVVQLLSTSPEPIGIVECVESPISLLASADVGSPDSILPDIDHDSDLNVMEPLDRLLALDTSIKLESPVTGKDETLSDSAFLDVEPGSDLMAVVPENLLINKTGLPDHIDTTQNNLDFMKELLSSSNYNLDTSTLMGVCADTLLGKWLETHKLFSPDEPLPSTSFAEQVSNGEINGTELIQYNPSLLDLADGESGFFCPEDNSLPADEAASLFARMYDPEKDDALVLNTPDPLLSMPSFEVKKSTRGHKKST